MNTIEQLLPSIARLQERLQATPRSASWALKWLGYPLFFVFCFALFAYVTFPYQRARDYLIQQVEYEKGADGSLKPTGIRLQIGELRPSWLNGVSLSDVHFTKMPSEADGTPLSGRVDELTVSTSWWALLTGGIDVEFDAQVGDGSLEGQYETAASATHVRSVLEKVDLSQLGVLDALVGIPVRGVADGALDLTLAEERKETRGDVQLKVVDLVMGDGESKLKLPEGPGLTIDPLEAGTLDARLGVEEGVARIEKLRAEGPDIELNGEGSLTLARPIQRSRMNLVVELRFTDRYKKKSDRTQAMFELMQMQPALKRAKTSNGGLRYRIRGLLGNPRGLPAGG